jgi:hypothetical protein
LSGKRGARRQYRFCQENEAQGDNIDFVRKARHKETNIDFVRKTRRWETIYVLSGTRGIRRQRRFCQEYEPLEDSVVLVRNYKEHYENMSVCQRL